MLPKVGEVEKVFFYGASCSLPLKVEQVKKAIDRTIQAHRPAEVSGDMLGAARSLLQDQPGISCILGTGANSCVDDGNKIVQNVPSLGFILADWGSGTVMSKELISLFLQEKLSAEMNEDFRLTYGFDRRYILDYIYNKPMANRFLVSFTPFLLKHAEEPVCREVILSNFRSFFNYYVLGYPQPQGGMKLSITGSVAHHFSTYLLEVAGEMGIEVEKIVQSPIEGLVQYHSITVTLSR